MPSCIKDYSYGVPIQISVYEDHIVLWNYGHMPDEWTMERFLGKHPSEPFNPLLANAFFRAGYIESWGRGIEKIESECKAHGIEVPKYEFDRSGLMMTFQANPEHLEKALGGKELGERLGERLGETRAAIVTAMLDDSKVTVKKLAESLGISTTAIEKNIKYLQLHGYVQRIGSAKGGHWAVKGNERQ